MAASSPIPLLSPFTLSGNGIGAVLSIIIAGIKVRISVTKRWSCMLSGASKVIRSFCKCKRANGVDLSSVSTLGNASTGILATLLATPVCTVSWHILACSPKLVLSACCSVLCRPASPTKPLHVYKLPLLSTPTMSSIGVNTCAGGAGAGTTTGAVTTASTGGALLGLINNAQTSPIAVIAPSNTNVHSNRSLR